ncbi:chromosomal replication initiator DnaA [Tabrizicola sp. TH137]|uniref:DnaA ATPase domain-containing protein n=1 Tax=Tabrizicola sp. TH137 TaxID=2067452 RepID=UPI000C7B2454|nr:DnaA/Hda family protein [Tabrizicola sp. TH137]PLL11434.1 chromosomal replication initiator DnaA [Tabrizicola sp. TH137]
MIRQLTFDLPARTAWRREDFFVSPANAAALAALDDWRHWPGGKMVLTGPKGSGKTHLAKLWAAETGAAVLPATALAGADLPALSAHGAVAVEDAEAVAGDGAGEAAFFHLHNLVTQAGHLLVTAATPPRDWPLALPDLASRLQAAGLARIEAPDDALLSAVLIKLFSDRQIAVPPAVIPYMVARMERSIDAARDLVAALDARALAEGRPITRALAAEVMGG